MKISDPYILLSSVNMKLRDSYDSLDELCASLDIDRKELEEKLGAIGYTYNPATNSFSAA